MKKYIDVTREIRQDIMAAFNVTGKMVYYALNYDAKRGESDKAKRIRVYAKQKGGIVMVEAPEVETIHDAEGYKQFKKGVKEILKSIRRTGGYISTNPSDTPEEIMARALIVAQKTIEQSRQRIQMLESENESLTQENRALAPRAAYTDKVLQSASTYTFTQMAKELGFTSVNTLIRKLRDRHVIFRQSGQWLLMAKYSAHGYTATRTAHYFRADGTPDCSVSTVWTERGRAFLHTLLGEKGGER